MMRSRSLLMFWGGPLMLALVLVVFVPFAEGQRPVGRKTAKPSPTPIPSNTEPLIISRASDYPDPDAQPVPADGSKTSGEEQKAEPDSALIEELKMRIAELEKAAKGTNESKQRQLLLNLDILSKAEQRSDSLRKQYFEMVEKESTIKTRLDGIETSIRPESIEREVAFAGTLRPEALRDMRKKQLELERTHLQSMLAEIQRTKMNLEQNLQRSETLVEKLRAKFEKEIDDALMDDDQDQD